MTKQAIVMILDLYKGGKPKVVSVTEYNGEVLKDLLLEKLVKHFRGDCTAEEILECADGKYTSKTTYTIAGEEESYTVVVV